MEDSRLSIYRGQDKSFLTRLKSVKTGDPYSLVGVTLIQVMFTRHDRSKIILSNVITPALKATATKGSVIFIADLGGSLGNAIALDFNGVDSYDDIVAAWNITNPTNIVVHNAPDGTQAVSEGSVQLSGGYNSYQAVQIWGNPELGKIQVNIVEKETAQLRAGTNHSFSIVVDKGETPSGSRNAGKFENKVDVKEL